MNLRDIERVFTIVTQTTPGRFPKNTKRQTIISLESTFGPPELNGLRFCPSKQLSLLRALYIC